jgi:4-amino-4-deoxy-L-arabinose transferase-like glycosyltransferase
MEIAAGILLIALAADAVLLLVSRAYFSRHPIGNGDVRIVSVFGKKSHLLTFLLIMTKPVGRLFSKIKKLPGIRISAFALLLGAGCVAAGQIMRQNESRDWVSAGLILGGLALFAGGVLLSNKESTLESLLLAPAAFLRVRPGQLLLLAAGLGLSFATSYLAGDRALMKNPTQSILCYLMGIVMVTAGAWQEGSSLGKNTRNALLWAAGLTLLALPLRAYNVGGMPIVMNGDEGTFGLGGVEAAEGRLTNIFATGPFSYPILSFWFISLPIRILGRTITAARIISVLAGTLTIGVFYLAARRIFDHTTALLAGLFLAILHYHIQFSRLSVNNIWDGLFYVIVLGCLWSGWREEKRVYYVIGGLALGFSQFFYASSRVLVAVVVFYVVGLAIRDWPRFKRALPDMVLMGLVALVVFLPLGLFYLRHPDEFMAPMNRVDLSPEWFASTTQSLGISSAALLWQQLKLNLLVYTDITFRTWYDSQTPMLLTIPAIFFFFGIVLLFLRKKFAQAWLIGNWLGWITLTGTLSLDSPAAQRFPAAAPAVALLVGFGLKACLDLLIQFWPGWKRVWTAGLVLLMVGIAWGEFQHYFLDYIPRSFFDENTMTANTVAKYVQGKPAGTQVCIFAEPQMGFNSIASLPFLTPGITGSNCVFPATEDRPTPAAGAVNVFFPHRSDELTALRQAYPDGKLTEVPGVYRPVLIWIYDLSE